MSETAVASEAPGIVPVTAWADLPWLRAGFSTRQGGLSHVYGPIYSPGEQNLGWTAQDDPSVIATNRRRFLAAVTGGAPTPLVTAQQVHGSRILDLDAPLDDGRTPADDPLAAMTPEGKARFEADGLTTRTPGILLGVVTADCVPVLVVDTRQRAVGAFHAGWRGTVAHIAQEGVLAMWQRYGSRSEELRAAIGPCIRACCFEVGGEVRERFQEAFGPDAEQFFQQHDGSLTLDLQACNRHQLLAAGLGENAIEVVPHCTACSRLEDGRRRYFSHRAEKGITGRMLSVIGVGLS